MPMPGSADLKRPAKGGVRGDPAAAALEVLARLEAALAEERQGLDCLDEKAIVRAGQSIEKLLQKLAPLLTASVSCDPEKGGLILSRIQLARRLREDNRALIKKAIAETGIELKRSGSGRRAARAYRRGFQSSELFLKKDC